MTVTGPVDAESLGVTLSHEHILIDIRNQFRESDDAKKARLGCQDVSMSHLGLLRRNPYALKDNLILDDVRLAVEELAYFKAAGGGTVIDCTPVGAGRDAKRIHAIAEQSGLNIIVGCGYYTNDTHPPELADKSVEEIADEMISDLAVGIDDTEIKAGMVGEIGTSDPVTKREMKVVRAAAMASRRCTAPVNIHTYPWCSSGLEIVESMVELGTDPKKIVICHTDVDPDVTYIRSLFTTGVFVEFDNFGKEFYINKIDRRFAGGIFATDLERVRLIKRILGWGYDHIITNVVPMMMDEGIPREAINRILVDNPARLFD